MPKKRTNNKKKEKAKKLDVCEKDWSEQTADEQDHTIKQVAGVFNELKLGSVEIVVAKETQHGTT